MGTYLRVLGDNEYQHDRVKMVFKNLCICVFDESRLSIGRVNKSSITTDNASTVLKMAAQSFRNSST